MNNVTEIIPAILPKGFAELKDKTQLVSGLVNTIQIDICDGQFVHNITWPYKKHDEYFDKILHEEDGLPEWEKVDFEIDLMINYRDESDILDWVTAGASRIIIHVESRGDLLVMMGLANGLDIGLALNIDTPISEVEKYAEKINFVQLMGIDNIGFQGQKFDEKVIDKIREVRNKFPELPISIDGGVTIANANLLIDAGANRLVVGSAIFDSDNFVESIEEFKKIAGVL